MFKRIVIAIVALTLTAGCQKKHREGVAITVNGYDITDIQVKQAAEMLHQSMLAAYPQKVMEGISPELTAGAAQQLIANRLLTEEAIQRRIEPSPASVDSACQLLKKRFPDEAAFQRELTKMGETDSSFRSQIKEGVRLDSLMRAILGTIKDIDTQECRAFYEKHKDQYVGPGRVRASQIFLPFTDSMSADAKGKLTATMQDIRQKILGGADFASLAKKHSKGPGAIEGGDIGWFKAGDLREDLEKPLMALKKGETSEIVPTAVGLFLLLKTDEEAEKQLSYDEVKDRVRMLLEIKTRNDFVGRHIDSLIAKAKITYYDTTLAHGPSLRDMQMTPGAE
jgi:parvulin-like peptidyl-prolyl isomerase